MTFVDGVQVWMEPYMACHMNDTCYNPTFGEGNVGYKFAIDKLHAVETSPEAVALREEMQHLIDSTPGVIDQTNISWPWVKQQLDTADPDKKFIFIKDQSGVIYNHLEFLPSRPNCHTFLIRHPREVYASYRVMFKDLLRLSTAGCDQYKLADFSAFLPPEKFYQIHHKLWKQLSKDSKEKPIIIDAYDLVTKPDVVIPKYFERIGIPFKESYLRWDASDEITQKWKGSGDHVFLDPKTSVFSRAAQSGTFAQHRGERGTPSNTEWPLTTEIQEYIDAALPFYEEMYQQRLR